ncbi:hypothetical protein H5S09_02770 [Limosilactobacillus sp. STM2_1]|uniref:Uncharacterized protein n=1 Tax=Limosilactobacillus rudii TaxID=2759755 RepID=A0A7W3YM95_9LACO|nr:hypothetical protein [Limosilactobacillus rudii]MBB1080223.1 hypothetical protein [Limosilactobacillus rudii]MBB1096873.1 hypothetical protein [Limosilactobacillus rudii]MCD7133771.1 hypothetical protein [Limosilactobacillus rudii]
MTKEEIFNDFIKKVKWDHFQIINVCRSNRDNVQSFSFDIADKQTATNFELANKLSKENAEIAGRINRLDEFMDTEEYRHLSDKEQRLMLIQYNAMQVYADVLLQRIDELEERL